MTTDQLNVMIYEPDAAAQDKLRRYAITYGIRADTDVQLNWLRTPEEVPYAAQLAADMHIALLNADAVPCCYQIGEQILQANVQCCVVYYGARTQDLATYFPARPVYYQDDDSEEAWMEMLGRFHQRIRSDSNYFSWTSKFNRYYIPCSQIISLHSSKTNVEIRTVNAGCFTMVCKLDEAEAHLPQQSFLRIHKSTLVNVHKILALDRSERCLLMQDGSRAYISKVHYKAVSEYMRWE